ncbi:MAG: DUF4962 domain-containing protein [Firmicutes bacterium]|nr:DUF4962 domain-containing protein [Bacillota bacterium]
MTIILYSTPANVGVSRWDEPTLVLVPPVTTLDVEVLDMQESDEALPYTPADGAVVTINPPSFIWVPVPGAIRYTLEYSTEPDFPAQSTVIVEDIDRSIYTSSAPFDTEPTWYWRVKGVDAQGNESPYSTTRAFRIAHDAPIFPLPDLASLRAQIPTTHPRLYVTQETLPQWRQRINTEPLLRLVWNDLRIQAFASTVATPSPEPPHPRITGVFDQAVWREANAQTERATSHMEQVAFAYMITGEEAYAEAARRHIMNMARWDPNGATSATANWDSSMPILLGLARSYTWAYDALTEEERAFVRNVIKVRTEQHYRIARNRPYESKPYASHPTASLAVIGQAAIVLMHEVPEAAEWLDYVIKIYTAIFPTWGGDDGGWSEGHAYWDGSLARHYWLADALRAVTDYDLYKKPFFARTGYFKTGISHP